MPSCLIVFKTNNVFVFKTNNVSHRKRTSARTEDLDIILRVTTLVAAAKNAPNNVNPAAPTLEYERAESLASIWPCVAAP